MKRPSRRCAEIAQACAPVRFDNSRAPDLVQNRNTIVTQVRRQGLRRLQARARPRPRRRRVPLPRDLRSCRAKLGRARRFQFLHGGREARGGAGLGGLGSGARATKKEAPATTKKKKLLAEIRHAVAQAVQVTDGGHVRPAVVGPGRRCRGSPSGGFRAQEAFGVWRSCSTRRHERCYFVKS